ncbi:MAG: sarcosine oxidase subunit delta [Nocardioides sp.]
MMQIPCPVCGPRHADEFRYVGELAARPDPAATTPTEWRDYLYLRRNRAGWTMERWYHRAGCRRYFVVERDTVTHEIRLLS